MRSSWLLYSLTVASLSTILPFAAAAGGDVNTFCILMHCGGKAISCQQTASCNQVLSCSQACPKGDLACSEVCQTRFGTSQFDELSVCLIQHNCMEPYPPQEFTAPTQHIQMDLQEFVGSWYVAAGLDRGLDCYSNQTMIISADDGEIYNHDIIIQFPEGPRKITTKMRQKSPGLYSLHYTLGGGGDDTWYVLAKSDSIIVLVYIGKNSISNYRGGYVLKKTPTDVTADEITFVEQSLQGSGISFDQFCRSLL